MQIDIILLPENALFPRITVFSFLGNRSIGVLLRAERDDAGRFLLDRDKYTVFS